MAGTKTLIECIAACDGKGGLKPLRIRFEDKEGKHIINVDKIIEQEAKKTYASMGNPAGIAYHYKCESIIDGMRMPFKLMYDNNSCKWYLM